MNKHQYDERKDFDYPGYGNPGMGYPGMGPGMGYPGMGPGMGYPGMGPGMGYPGMGPGMGYGYYPFPQQVLAITAPIVDHGKKELRRGVPVNQVLEEVAAASYLAGTGMLPQRAIRIVERWEEMGFIPYRKRR